MHEIVVNSPAKINLGLNILDKRIDGYHNLETIFYPLKLSDKITFKISDKFSFETNNNFISSESSNLIIKAKELLEDISKEEINCDVFLEKNIPVGAGLGGGSSNAAITLLTLDKMLNLNLSDKKLSELALKLGSDVPFFLNPVPSIAKSRGENLKEISLQLEGYLVLVNPRINISTKWAFENLKSGNRTLSYYEGITEKIKNKEDIMDLITNDFEPIVFEKYPQIKSIKEKLINMGAYCSSMTGTGSTVFGVFRNSINAESAMEKFQKEYFTYIEKL